LHVSLGSKTVGIQAASLTTVLLLIAGCVGGYLIYTAMDHRLEAILAGQARTQVVLEANRATILDALHAQQAFIVDQAHQGRQRHEQQAELLRRLVLILELPPEVLGGATPLRPPGP
jgi:hypothetical protein